MSVFFREKEDQKGAKFPVVVRNKLFVQKAPKDFDDSDK